MQGLQQNVPNARRFENAPVHAQRRMAIQVSFVQQG